MEESSQLAPSARGQWADPVACQALCQLILDDRYVPVCTCGVEHRDVHPQRSRRKTLDLAQSHCTCVDKASQRPPLPATLYVEHVAPYLRFEEPLPNMLYLFGGRVPFAGFQTLRLSNNVIHDSVEMFDTWHGCWVQCQPMPRCRAGGAAACLPDGRILVSGGYDERGVVDGLLSTCDAYDPQRESWQACVSDLLRARWGHGCTTLGKKIVAVGGCSVWQPGAPHVRNAFMETLRSCEIFEQTANDASGSWHPMAPLQVARSGARVVALGERYLVAVGGCEDPFGRVQMQASVELYDVQTGCWSLLDAHLSNPRTCAAVASLSSHQIVAVGGSGANDQPPGSRSSCVEVFGVDLPHEELHDDKETVEEEFNFHHGVPDLLAGRVGCQAAVLNLPSERSQYPLCENRCLVAIGGERCDRKADVQIFARALNLETGTWCSSDVLPSSSTAPRTAVALCVGSGRVAGARLRSAEGSSLP